jgi:glycosyltransferase involved in cell wall biosynthesis
MRIAYLCHCDFDGHPESSGVYRKILYQVECWRRLGNDVAVFHISASDRGAYGTTDLVWHVFPYARRSYVGRTRAWNSAARSVLRWRPDVVYHRYDLWYPAVQVLARRVPLVLEVNTDDLGEYRMSSRVRSTYNRLTRGSLLRASSGLVFVSAELSKLPQYDRFGKPYVVIGNGIRLEDYAVQAPTHDACPRLVFLGSDKQPWQSIDDILALAGIKADWLFDLVGFSGSRPTGRNVTCHGSMCREEYERILGRADVAIGTLALYRNGLTESSSLKVREYLAYGLPVIMGSKDTDFPLPVPFILQLPNCQGSLVNEIAAVDGFVSKWMGKRVPREDVLQIDVEPKERRRLLFLEQILELHR